MRCLREPAWRPHVLRLDRRTDRGTRLPERDHPPCLFSAHVAGRYRGTRTSVPVPLPRMTRDTSLGLSLVSPPSLSFGYVFLNITVLITINFATAVNFHQPAGLRRRRPIATQRQMDHIFDKCSFIRIQRPQAETGFGDGVPL